MNLHGQIKAACESRPGHPQPCHWSVWIVLECGFHMLSYKMDFSSCTIMLGFGKSSHIYVITLHNKKGGDSVHGDFIQRAYREVSISL